jgi:hypothetical protein
MDGAIEAGAGSCGLDFAVNLITRLSHRRQRGSASGKNVGGPRYNMTMTVASQEFPPRDMSAPRLAAVPDASPPYDCATHSQERPRPDLPQVADVVAFPAGRRPAAGRGAGRPDGPGDGMAWPRRFAQAIVEAVAGTRPVRQIVPSTTEQVQAQVHRLIPLLRTGTGARIQRILTSQTDIDVVEVTVIAGFGPRTRALAMRFEQQAARAAAPGLPPRPARWLCTDIETA